MPDIPERLTNALAEHYRLERHLGEGGMATVYLAHDLKHDRPVAVKVLRPELAAIIGGERFVNEIKVTANLQHPNILPLYDSGEADGFLYYVMPFVEGESLRDRLNNERQLPVDETVDMGRAICGALEYAHEQGVVHRDIKPENILLQRGQPLVADFGIALAVSQAGGSRLTETGLSLGTPHYMSPEQAAGDRTIDGRTDIYSLGAMLYEMLTGEPPYAGNSVQAVIAKILSERPSPITQTRDMVPQNVDAAIQRALAKSPADRFTSAGRLADALINPSYTLPLASGAVGPSTTRVRPYAWVVAVAVLTGVAAWGWLRPVPDDPVISQRIELWDYPVGGQAVRFRTALAPDGSALAYTDSVGGGLTDGGTRGTGGAIQLFLKSRGEARGVPLAGTEGAVSPFFSPDGQWIGFFVAGTLRKIPRGGGAALTLTDSTATNSFSGAWGEGGTIYYTSLGWNLSRIPETGGEPEIVVRAGSLQRFITDLWPLPGGRGVFFTGCTGNCAESQVYVYDAEADTTRMLFEEARGIWYVPTGYVLYASRTGGVFAAPFDLGRLELSGAAVPVLDDVGAPNFTLANDGTVLYRVGDVQVVTNVAEAVWVSRDGSATTVDRTWRFDAGGSNRGWSLSPDGSKVAVSAVSQEGRDIWVKELPNGPSSRLTLNGSDNRKPRWSADGEEVMFISLRSGDYDVWTKRADGAAEAAMLVDTDGFAAYAVATRDRSTVLIRTGGATNVEGGRDILIYRPGVDSVATPLLAGQFDEWEMDLSKDDRWLAYVSTEAGQPEVFARPFPDVNASRVQVSVGGGTAPLWAHSGRELFYVSQNREMMVARIETTPTFRVVSREVLFEIGPEYMIASSGDHIDISRDDQRFFMVRAAGSGADVEGPPPYYVLAYNWFKELEQKVRGR